MKTIDPKLLNKLIVEFSEIQPAYILYAKTLEKILKKIAAMGRSQGCTGYMA
ncbi:MAG: hypothetical protein U9N55_10020 [candidate division Zixibacteria bacterium]|nr:hypothetical protein [candidate division Zixibacteria bacterium]